MMKTTFTKMGAYDVMQMPMPHFTELTLGNAPRAGVLHTTEGGWDGSMDVFHVHYAPHFIIGVDAHMTAAHRLGMSQPPEPVGEAVIAQMVNVGTIGAALVTHNNEAVVQVEVIGYAQQLPWLFEEGTLDAVANFMAAMNITYGIPLTRPWPDGVYGMAGNTKHRNGGQFGHVAGWFGHGDVPSPDTHWDPGNLQWGKVFDRARKLVQKGMIIA